MKYNSVDELITSVAKITQHDDREQLDEALAQSLVSQLNLDQIQLYKIYYKYNQPHTHLILDISEGSQNSYPDDDVPRPAPNTVSERLSTMILHKDPVSFINNTNRPTILLPVFNHINEMTNLFLLSSSGNLESSKELINGFFKIYLNHLKVLNESQHDTLTGLLNRRSFDRDLDKLMSDWTAKNFACQGGDLPEKREISKTGNGNWLAVVDIDFFKRINDTYGHLYGDEVLLLLSNIMRDTFRNYDKLFRFGGEEFIVILRNTNPQGAEAALARFHRAIREYNFPQIGTVTVSIGYHEIANLSVPSEVLRLADDALYYAKDNGRDRICCYEQLLSENKIGASKAPARDDIELF